MLFQERGVWTGFDPAGTAEVKGSHSGDRDYKDILNHS